MLASPKLTLLLCLQGMLQLHSKHIVHRDLKSPNLLVDKHWRVKIGDFNLSRVEDTEEKTASITANNPRWLAPEVISVQVRPDAIVCLMVKGNSCERNAENHRCVRCLESGSSCIMQASVNWWSVAGVLQGSRCVLLWRDSLGAHHLANALGGAGRLSGKPVKSLQPGCLATWTMSMVCAIMTCLLSAQERPLQI